MSMVPRSPTVPEVHHTCTFLFAMQFLLARLRSRTSLANYIISCNFVADQLLRAAERFSLRRMRA